MITKATVRLVADAPHKIMIALGYASMPEAADATPALLGFAPTAIEGLDRRIVEVVRRTRGDGAVPPLPRGDGWVFVELVGDDPGELPSRAAPCSPRPAAWTARWWPTRPRRWPCGRSARTAPAWPGSRWPTRRTRAGRTPPYRRSSSVAYLRDFDALLHEHGLHGLPYGHFGDGCVHCGSTSR